MTKAGIIGGLGPASTIDYYHDIVENYRKKYGDDSYPELIIYSVDMHEIVSLIENQKYEELANIIIKKVSMLGKAGADFVAIASNSPHIAWKYIDGKTDIPVVSIIEATCNCIKEQNFKKVLIFATEFTMKNGLYSEALEKHQIDYILPEDRDISILGNIIYPNLENAIVIAEDKQCMIDIAEKYISKYSCDALLLGCTEIPLMIKPGDVSVPVIDTTKIHVEKICRLIEKA